MSKVTMLSPAAIAPSRTNPRKHFNEAAMLELAESVRADGVLQPLLVRPHPKPKKAITHELIAGERRWRAANQVKLDAVPVIVLDVDDRKACELQVIENSQRADLHPMEEAEGYEALMQKHGATVEEIAAKVGKSKAAIYARLKLCDLCDKARKALYADEITASVALLIARIPHKDLQEQALDEIADRYDGSSLSYRSAAEVIQRNFMTVLSSAPFSPKDADLVPAAGACTACPKRTGNQPDLFADVGKKDCCTDPKCFAEKRQAWQARQFEEHRGGGGEVIEKPGLFNYGHLKSNSRYADLNESSHEIDYETWGKVLGRKHALPVTLAVDDKGEIHQLVDKAAAVEALKKSGKIKKTASGEDRDWKVQERERSKKKQLLDKVAREATTAALAALDLSPIVKLPSELLGLLARAVDDRNDLDTTTFIARRRGLAEKSTETRKAMDKWIAAAPGAEDVVQFLIESLVCARWNDNWEPRFSSSFKGFCEFAGVDLAALEKAAKAAAKKAKKGKATVAEVVDNNFCEGCGCTEAKACRTPGGVPCHWVRKPTKKKPGLCSACA